MPVRVKRRLRNWGIPFRRLGRSLETTIAAIQRADSAVVDSLLRLLDACLRADDLRLG